MKKVFVTLFILFMLGLFVYVGYFLYQKNQEDPVVYKTITPFYTDIVKKTVANGSVIPRKEIALKPQISGIVDRIFVIAGDQVVKGQVIARIKVIPDDVTLSNAESTLNRARISLAESKLEKERREKLFEAKAISEVEYNAFLFDFQRRTEELEVAENNLQLIQEGVSKNKKETTTLVKSTILGMVLDVPIEEGQQVIETNNFNDGSTIASVADMSDLIFECTVDESEFGKLKEGMELLITVGAIDYTQFEAKLEYISPKGIDDQGTIQFEIRAALGETGDARLRAGYSANADIILDRRDSVLAINERDILFEQEGLFVDVETGEQQFEKRVIKTGLSDGINIEILSGLSENEKIKILN